MDDQSATTAGTTSIYEKYNTGYYKEQACTNQMTTSTNGITIPEKAGYTFGGYYTSTNGGGTQYIDSNGKLTSDASTTNFSNGGNLYAKWTAISYNITYHLNNSGVTNNSINNPNSSRTSYTIEDSQITLGNLTTTAAGWVFDGWYSDDDYSTSCSTIAAGSTGNKEFYAHWKFVFYFNPGVWATTRTANAKIELNANSKWYDYTVTTNGFKFTIDQEDIGMLIFVRFNSSHTSGSWNDKWNQTVDITNASSNIGKEYSIDSWNSGDYNNSTVSVGNKKTYKYVFLDISSFTDYKNDNVFIMANTWKEGTGSAQISMISFDTNKYVALITSTYDKIQFYRANSTSGDNYNYVGISNNTLTDKKQYNITGWGSCS